MLLFQDQKGLFWQIAPNHEIHLEELTQDNDDKNNEEMDQNNGESSKESEDDEEVDTGE